ncbi:SRPBCC domain-containing protein [Muriicola sp. E247]|uniref:SRPBCC family protein n=1 Tax=Muriicola sp. E247 TaxID=3242730 RepID=UPI003524DED9
MKKSDSPIIIKVNFNKGQGILWNALTQLSEMKKWYFEVLKTFEAREGFKTSFKVSSEDRMFTHKWKVIEVIPGQKITYSWQFDEYPGKSTSTFEISGNEHKSELTLTVLVQEDFPSGIPEFKRESCISGWEYFLKGNLKDYLSA